MREPLGKTLIARIVTSLTILQNKSIDLKVQEQVSHTVKYPTQFEIPQDDVVTTQYNKADILLAHSQLPSTLNKN